jgi:hypothetical protein
MLRTPPQPPIPNEGDVVIPVNNNDMTAGDEHEEGHA